MFLKHFQINCRRDHIRQGLTSLDHMLRYVLKSSFVSKCMHFYWYAWTFRIGANISGDFINCFIGKTFNITVIIEEVY